jgi:hypothetical protein
MEDLAAHPKQIRSLIQCLTTSLPEMEPGHIFTCHIQVIDAATATLQGQHGPNSGN